MSNQKMQRIIPPFITPVDVDNYSPESGLLDAFSRLRVSSPQNIFDDKQIFKNTEIVSGENQPLFFDNQEVSGTGTATLFDVNRASTTLSVSANTAGKRVRQTKMWFNYQPGKPVLSLATFVMGDGIAGVTKRVGLFDDENGIFFEQNGGNAYVAIRSYVTGTTVDRKVEQANWNLDTLNGSNHSNNPSGINLDLSKAQLLIIDYEWLGVGTVRIGFVIDGEIHYVHIFKNANVLDSVYMSTCNLPIRVSIENDGTGGAASIEHICVSVFSEGGLNPTGTNRAIPPSAWYNSITQADVVGTLYPIVGIRLKQAYKGLTVLINRLDAIALSNDDFILSPHFNPTISGAAVTWNNIPESGIQYALTTTRTVTNPCYVFDNFMATGFSSIDAPHSTAVRLGFSLSNVPDEIWLCVTPLSTLLDILGTINWRELS